MAKYTEWTSDLDADLIVPFDNRLVEKKRMGGTDISFVAWHHYVRRLNSLVGSGWSMGEPVFHDVGGKLLVGLPVTIFGVTRINFGDEDGDKDNYGTAATNAWAQAFKRTMALFGMGLYMYDKNGSHPIEPKTGTEIQIEALMASKQIRPTDRRKLELKFNAGLTPEKAEELLAWLKTREDA